MVAFLTQSSHTREGVVADDNDEDVYDYSDPVAWTQAIDEENGRESTAFKSHQLEPFQWRHPRNATGLSLTLLDAPEAPFLALPRNP